MSLNFWDWREIKPPKPVGVTLRHTHAWGDEIRPVVKEAPTKRVSKC